MADLLAVGRKLNVLGVDDPIFSRLVQQDLERSRNDSKLPLAPDQKDALLVQTVLGHAQAGHKVFRENYTFFPNATITDVIAAAGLDVEKIRRQRQDTIDAVFEWVEEAKREKINKLSVNGKPLLGINFLSSFTVNPEYVLRGMILGGLMDNYEWRTRTKKEYGGKRIDGDELEIGGGSSYLVDMDKLLEWDPFAIEYLANHEISEETIDDIRKRGIIIDKDNSHADVVYIRKRLGLGTSDDTAFIFSGEICKDAGEENYVSAFWGTFIVDAVDTYDKCVANPITGGYDEKMGNDLRTQFPDLVLDKDIMKLIYYSAKGNVGRVVSSSHKRLIQMVENADHRQSTIEHHLKFLKTGTYAPFHVGFERQPSRDFYSSVNQRLDDYAQKKDLEAKRSKMGIPNKSMI